MGFGQGLNSLLESCFFCREGLLLVPQALEGELPLTLCIQKKITLMPSDFETMIGCLEVVLKLCLLYTSPSPRDGLLSRMPSSA